MDIKPLDIDVKISTSNGKIYEMIDYDEYTKNKDRYLDRDDIGIEIKDKKSDTKLLLPLKKKESDNPISPGIYNQGPFDYIIYPDEINKPKYVPDKVVRLGNKMDAAEIIKTGQEIRHLDEAFITTPDNITKIPIQDDDQPEMICLKRALNDKNIDLDKYAGRFGDNFPNDKRQLKNRSATLNIIKRYCKNCDMEAILTLRDANPDVPNPIGHEITVSLTDGYEDEDE